MLSPEEYGKRIVQVFREEIKEVKRVFIQKQQRYWFFHPVELRRTLLGLDQWDGYLWTKAVELLLQNDWFLFISWIHGEEVSQETHVQDQMLQLIKSVSPYLPT